jgi:hypothetical protein
VNTPRAHSSSSSSQYTPSRRAQGWRAISRQHVARPAWPVATPKSKLTARRLVITFVPTTGWKLEDSRRAGAVTQAPSESSHRTRSIAAMTARDRRGRVPQPAALGVRRHPHQCWTCGLSLRFPVPIRHGTALAPPGHVSAARAADAADAADQHPTPPVIRPPAAGALGAFGYGGICLAIACLSQISRHATIRTGQPTRRKPPYEYSSTYL